MVEAVKWDSSNGKEHSSIMDADLEVGDEETTTSTQYSNGRALHSSSSSSVKVRFLETSDRDGGKAGNGKRTCKLGFRPTCVCPEQGTNFYG